MALGPFFLIPYAVTRIGVGTIVGTLAMLPIIALLIYAVLAAINLGDRLAGARAGWRVAMWLTVAVLVVALWTMNEATLDIQAALDRHAPI